MAADRRFGVPAGCVVRLDAETVPIDSFGAGGWLRLLAFAATAAAAPIACAAGCAAGRVRPAFAALLCRSDDTRDGLSIALGVSFIALTLLSVQTALGLVFDPRYRDLPFAPQSAGVVAFLILMFRRRAGRERERRRKRWPRPCLRCRPAISRSMKASPIGRRSGSARA